MWAKTALFVTYDENDGFFDHLLPPFPPASDAQGRSTVDVGPDLFKGDSGHTAGPYGLGQRVPMLVISPWSKGGYVCSETLDHTSVIRFMERRFGVHEPNISPWRRAVCGDLTSAFDFSRRDTRPVGLPDTDGYRPPDKDRHPDYVPVPPAHPVLPKQERGTRPTRPLKYAPYVDASVDATTGKLTLAFASGRRPRGLPCHFRQPHRRAVELHHGGGPDRLRHLEPGVLRRFARPDRARPQRLSARLQGKAGAAGVEVAARHVGDGLELSFTHRGRGTVELKVTDGYGGKPTTVRLRPGAVHRRTLDLRASRRWYDLTVTSAADPAFLRRFAGHVENGLPGVSDPAIVTE